MHAAPLPIVRQPPADGAVWPGVSVVVVARNAAATIDACLASLRALDYPDVEVLVADDGSSDATVTAALGATVVETHGRGPAAARNLGVARARHEIVAVVEADCLVSRGWLKGLVDVLRRRKAVSASGPETNLFPEGEHHGARDVEALCSLASLASDDERHEEREVEYHAGGHAVYIKHALLEAGGFAEGMAAGEGVDLDIRLRRLGYRAWHAPVAPVQRLRPDPAGWLATAMRDDGRAQRALVERYGRYRARHYVPHALIALAAAQSLWLPRRTRRLALLVDGGLAAAVAAAMVTRVPPARRAAALKYATVALREWTRGYLEGRAPSHAVR